MTKVASARKTGSDRGSDDGFDDLSDSTAPPTGSKAKLLDKLQRDARTLLRQKQGVKKQLDNSLELASDKPSPFVRDQVYTLFTVGYTDFKENLIARCMQIYDILQPT